MFTLLNLVFSHLSDTRYDSLVHARLQLVQRKRTAISLEPFHVSPLEHVLASALNCSTVCLPQLLQDVSNAFDHGVLSLSTLAFMALSVISFLAFLSSSVAAASSSAWAIAKSTISWQYSL